MRRALLAGACIVLALGGCAASEPYAADSLDQLVLSEAAITAVLGDLEFYAPPEQLTADDVPVPADSLESIAHGYPPGDDGSQLVEQSFGMTADARVASRVRLFDSTADAAAAFTELVAHSTGTVTLDGVSYELTTTAHSETTLLVELAVISGGEPSYASRLVEQRGNVIAVTAYLWPGTTAPPWADALAGAARLP